MTRRKSKRLDKAIIIALIGLIGTIVTALLASPLLLKLVDKTSVPTEVHPPDEKNRPTFENDFEDGFARGFGFESGQWQVVKDKGNQVLEGRGNGLGNGVAIFGSNNFSNGIVEFQIKFIVPEIFVLTFRGAGSQNYAAVLSPSEIKLGYSNAANDWNLEPFSNGTRLLTLNKNTWYGIRLELADGQMTVWVDENRILSSSDSRLQQGDLEFSIHSEGVVFLDNVKVWEP